jgi:hypothetical protein
MSGLRHEPLDSFKVRQYLRGEFTGIFHLILFESQYENRKSIFWCWFKVLEGDTSQENDNW